MDKSLIHSFIISFNGSKKFRDTFLILWYQMGNVEDFSDFETARDKIGFPYFVFIFSFLFRLSFFPAFGFPAILLFIEFGEFRH